MRLKRFYKHDAAGNVAGLDYVSVGDTGITPNQNFSSGLIDAAVSEGWATLSKGQLILHVVPEDLVYTIKRVPGRYCCHCGEKLPDDATGELARSHVAREHSNAPSPDKQNPAGYCMVNAYGCELNAAQHEKFKVKNPARPPVFPQKGVVNG